MTIEYRCCKCMEKTDPPAPYKMYVLCSCGQTTSATAAAVRAGEQAVPGLQEPKANPNAAAFITNFNLNALKTEARVLTTLYGQANWVDEAPEDHLEPLFDQAYVSSLEAEIERLKNRVQMLESPEGKREIGG